jgi:LruC domain-containing protein
MKSKNVLHLSVGVLFLLALLFSVGCKKTDSPDIPPEDEKTFSDLKVAENFTWRTSMPLDIDLKFVDANQNPVVTAFSIWTKYPDGVKMLDGASRADGSFKRKYTVASARQSITIEIPGNDPVDVSFAEITIRERPAYQAKMVIAVNNPPLKSIMEETYAYYPCQGQFGTIGFEDNWPHKGDYDFNDVVIDYNVKATFNDDDLVSRIDMQLYLRAKGATYDNAFGISFRQYWSYNGPFPEIASVTVNGATIQPEETTYPAYILIPSTRAVMPTLNTLMTNPFDPPVEFLVEIVFTNPIDEWDLELPLQNPFIVIDQDRDREVHLPYDLPTSLADPSLAGTKHDASDPAAFLPENFKALGGYYTYMSANGHPWAIDVYFETGSNELFQYPVEFMPINAAYSSFESWVENWDPWEWYLPQYRVEGNVYTKIPEPPYIAQ